MQTVYSWAIDNISDELWSWVDRVNVDLNEDVLDVNLSVTQFTGSTNVHYENEPRSHTEAVMECNSAKERKLNAIEVLNYADVVEIPQDRNILPVMWVYKYKTMYN